MSHDPIPESASTPVVSSYGVWNRAIGEHFFRRGNQATSTYLAFDDAIATQIGRPLGMRSADFVAAVASVIHPDASDPFRSAALQADEGDFPYLGVLSAQVYVAAGMGSFANLDPSAFWKPFQQHFTGGQPLRPNALERFDSFWLEARTFYESRGRGRLAIQQDPYNVPHVGWRHINYALWQALLRETDRVQIREWLREQGSTPWGDGSALISALIIDADQFNTKLRQTLLDAKRSQALAEALGPLVHELQSDVGSPAGSVRHRARGRLLLFGRRLECVLQRSNGRGGWTDVTASLCADDVRHGIVDEATGTSWPGDDRVAFYDAGALEGFVSRRGGFPLDGPVILLCTKGDAEVQGAVSRDRWQQVALGNALEGMLAFRGVPDPQDDAALLDFFDAHIEDARAIFFESGLKYQGVYLKSAPPVIRVISSATHVTVDGVRRRVLPNGYVLFDVPLTVGMHVIACGDETRPFQIEDGDVLDDCVDSDEIGIVLDRNDAFRTSNVEFMRSARYLVGGYLAGSGP